MLCVGAGGTIRGYEIAGIGHGVLMGLGPSTAGTTPVNGARAFTRPRIEIAGAPAQRGGIAGRNSRRTKQALPGRGEPEQGLNRFAASVRLVCLIRESESFGIEQPHSEMR